MGTAIAGSIYRLGVMLNELDLIDEDNPGNARMGPFGAAIGIEADHPDDGKRLYGWSGDGTDTIVATRMREDGRMEHAVLDNNGAPIKWRTRGGTDDRPGS
jgi:hypothetical protein